MIDRLDWLWLDWLMIEYTRISHHYYKSNGLAVSRPLSRAGLLSR
jgi:hypothetical protein